MKRSRKVLASILSAALAASFCVPSAAFASAGSGLLATLQDLATATAAGDEEAIEHAYDPYAALEEEQAEQDYRESVDIVKKTVVFSVLDYREDGNKAAYLDDSSKIATAAGLTDVAVVYETASASAEQRAGFTAYEVYYTATTPSKDVWATVDKLNAHSDVLHAEPDYEWGSESTAITDYCSETEASNNGKRWEDDLDIKNVWDKHAEKNPGKKPGQGVVVAVIDTGVDCTHEDLQGSMWVNSDEIAGNGRDDDGNGYIDDVYGINLIASTGDPLDDNGHGTHVAGTIAMQSNGIGGVGLAYGAQIMAIKAGRSNGVFAASDIAKAITYAATNGADVINMSFGGKGKSVLVEAALADAAASCVLIAAAGNDGLPTTDAAAAGYLKTEGFYPAGYSYVMGVMSSEGNHLASYSNWDYSSNANCEYEMAAPGSGVYSCVPGSKYATWSGTSMAASAVSAAAAILRGYYPDKSQYTSRFIMGQLASATKRSATHTGSLGDTHIYPLLDIHDSMTSLPNPNLAVKDVYLFDSEDISAANNNDGVVQAGETIDLGATIGNQWGEATDVTISVSTKSPYASFESNDINIGSVGTYMTADNGLVKNDGMVTGVFNPVRITIADDAPNDARVTLNISIVGKNGLDSSDKSSYTAGFEYAFIIQNGVTLGGIIKEDMTLTSDKLWVLTSSLKVAEGATLTIEAGTHVQFWPNEDRSNPNFESTAVYILVDGRLISDGTKDKPVRFFTGSGHEQQGTVITTSDWLAAAESDGNSHYVELNYTNLTFDAGRNEAWPIDYRDVMPFCATKMNHCYVNQCGVEKIGDGAELRIGRISDTAFNDMVIRICTKTTIERALFQWCCVNAECSTAEDGPSFSNCVFMDNYRAWIARGIVFEETDGSRVLSYCSVLDSPQRKPTDSIIDSEHIYITSKDVDRDVDVSNNYWGTENTVLVKKMVDDVDTNVSRGDLIQEPFLTLADDMSSIYPFVTEAYITDVDGNKIDSVSCGQSFQFHVKFNRDMSSDVQPLVSFGGSEPWTDYVVSGDWASAREWMGNFSLSNFANQGAMYIRVKDAAAADDTWLKTGTDAGRFSFNVVKSSAQSMSLSATGALEENQLSWAQDDFETFAGYNLYRATVYDSTTGIVAKNFSKVNGSLITENSFIDASVDTGTEYYYYFTVVDTDFNESEPSNVVSATPLDGDGPKITHTPIASVAQGQSVTIKANVTDNVGVDSVALFYRMAGSENWAQAVMRVATGTTYQCVIGAGELNVGQLQYYITATDGANVTTSGSAELPNLVTIVDPLTVESLSLDKENLSLQVGDTKKLSCTVNPSGVVDPGITWDSNNIAVATVNACGTVTAQAPGTAVITATSKNGKYASCEVYVKKPSQTLIYMTGATASPGETIEVPVSISRNSGIASTNITFEYDPEVLEIVGASANPGVEGYQVSVSQDTPAGTKKVLWWGDSNYAADGLLYTLSVKVKAGAPVNVDKAITMSCRANDVCDEEKGLVDVYLKGGTISVKALLLGDVYEDGVLDVRDIVTLQRYLAKKETFTSHQVMLGNIVENGSEEPVTTADLLALAKLLLAA